MHGLFGIDIQTMAMLISLFASAISTALIAFLMPRRQLPIVRALMLLMGSVAIWAFCYAMELKADGLALKLWWVRLEYTGAVWTGWLFFRFAVIFSARDEWLSGLKGWSLGLIPALTVVGSLTNPHHHLLWSRAWLETQGPLSVLAYHRGWGFWVYAVFSYTMLLAATTVLFHWFLASGTAERRNVVVITIGLTVPWIGNFLYLTGVGPFQYIDSTPLAFSISGAAFFWGVLRHQMLELLPIAREAIIESMQDPVFVLNLDDQVVDLNSAAIRLSSGSRQSIVGQPMANVFPQLSNHLAHCRATDIESEEMTTPSRLWRVRHSLLTGRGGAPCGRLITLQDITGQRISKVVKALSEIEAKVDALVAAFGSELKKVEATSEETSFEESGEVPSDEELLHGPQQSGEGISQDEIDRLLADLD